MTNAIAIFTTDKAAEETARAAQRGMESILPDAPAPPNIPGAPGTDVAAQAKAEDEAQRQAREAQRRRALAASGRSDTILTGPLGVPGSAPGARRTILGG